MCTYSLTRLLANQSARTTLVTTLVITLVTTLVISLVTTLVILSVYCYQY